jgi:hypothetical protein
MHAPTRTDTHDTKWYLRYSVPTMITTEMFLRRALYWPLNHLIIQMLAQESFIKLNLLHHLLSVTSLLLTLFFPHDLSLAIKFTTLN